MNTDIEALLATLTSQTKAYLAHLPAEEEPLIVGIHTGGIWIAEHLHQALQLSSSIGILDISFLSRRFQSFRTEPASEAFSASS